MWVDPFYSATFKRNLNLYYSSVFWKESISSVFSIKSNFMIRSHSGSFQPFLIHLFEVGLKDNRDRATYVQGNLRIGYNVRSHSPKTKRNIGLKIISKTFFNRRTGGRWSIRAYFSENFWYFARINWSSSDFKKQKYLKNLIHT